jgi:hypothetical protein
MRSKDLHMAATADLKRRHVLVTGAIDQNDQNLIMRLQLPKPGLWTFIKAEVNLTKDPWLAWQITLGENFKIPRLKKDRLVQCRQFKRAEYVPDRGALVFTDGEVRPGESVLKVFNLFVEGKSLARATGVVLAHSRMAGAADPEAVLDAVAQGFGEENPSIEIEVPVHVIK